MSGWDIYWITRLDEIKGAFAVLAALSAAWIMFGAMFELLTPKIMKWLIISVASNALVAVFIPTTREAVAICVLPKIANSETVSELGQDAIVLVREWLEELKPKTEEK